MLIQNKEQLNKFKNILPDLINDEVYFISLSCRNKYLTTEEREIYGLSQTEMFARNIIRSKENFEYTLNKLESALAYKTTKNGMRLPEKALVTYININPSSMMKAYFMLQQEMNIELREITMALQKGKTPNYSGINLLDRKLMNCIQKSRSRKELMDIDFDVKKINLVKEFSEHLDRANAIYYIIKTHSGYHVLIKISSLENAKIRLDEIIRGLNRVAKLTDGGEVMINKNAMIPLPGTLQAGKLVKFVEL